MNLIEIAEQLKDVPDQYLMQEVQQPTGNYPSYLVISELGRRKRMRDSVMKQMPETTVAEDLAQPERQQAMAQMMQDQNMIQQAGGLNALPQAQQDLAALDMLSAQPQMSQMPQEIPAMAGGGMVSFRNGGYTDSYTTDEEIEAYRPRGFGSLFGMMPQGLGSGNVDYELIKLGYPRDQIAQMDPAMKRFITQRASTPAAAVAPAAVAPATRPTAQPAGQSGQANVQPQVPQAAPQAAPGVFTLPTDTERAAAAKAGLDLYKEAMPDRLSTFRTDLEKLQKESEGRKGSNINEALIQAGLGIMGSRAPSALQAIAEGGMGGLKGYREGMKDIRDSQNALRQSQLEMAKAEMLRDQGMYKAAQDAEERAINLRVKGAELAKIGSEMEVRRQLLPSQIANINAQTEYYRTRGGPKEISAAEYPLFEARAIAALKSRGIEKPSPEQIRQQIAIMRNPELAGEVPALNRGTLP